MVQQFVTGEASSTDYGYSTHYGFSTVTPLAEDLKEPEAPLHTTEPSMTDQTELVEEIDKGEVQPPPTIQVRRFSIDWDPIQ